MGMQQGQMGGMQQQQMGPNQGGNNTSTASKNIKIDFLVKDNVVGVQGNNNMTIDKLIKNFKIKLCNDDIKIEKYIIQGTNAELDPTSTKKLCDKEINENAKIIVKTQ
jgi:hypothetical protein